MILKSVHIIVKGRVQGVGFRYFAKQIAEKHNIAGWVRNMTDGNVEIEATGEPGNISIFIDWLKLGPTRARINSLSVSEFTPIRTTFDFIIH